MRRHATKFPLWMIPYRPVCWQCLAMSKRDPRAGIRCIHLFQGDFLWRVPSISQLPDFPIQIHKVLTVFRGSASPAELCGVWLRWDAIQAVETMGWCNGGAGLRACKMGLCKMGEVPNHGAKCMVWYKIINGQWSGCYVWWVSYESTESVEHSQTQCFFWGVPQCFYIAECVIT